MSQILAEIAGSEDYATRNELLERILQAGSGSGLAIYATTASTAVTTVTPNPATFAQAMVDSIAPIESAYAGPFSALDNGEAAIVHTGDESDYVFRVGGVVVVLDPAFLGTYIGVTVEADIQGAFTGGTKFYPVGVSFGIPRAVGFDVTVYGRFPVDEVVRVKLSSNEAGPIILRDCIYSFERIRPMS